MAGGGPRLEDANIAQVLGSMQNDGCAQGTVMYNDGPHFSVD